MRLWAQTAGHGLLLSYEIKYDGKLKTLMILSH